MDQSAQGEAHGDGHGHGHPHRSAAEHWGQIRHKKDPTIWIVLGVTGAASVILVVIYLLLS